MGAGRLIWWVFLAVGGLLAAGGFGNPGESAVEEALMVIGARSQELTTDAGGHNSWKVRLDRTEFPADRTAFLICDMWDRHWSRGATERVAALAPRINEVASALRKRGVLIVHAPSETMEFYAGVPARLRIAGLSSEPLEKAHSIDLPILPIDDSDGGSDTGEQPWYKAWSRQHSAIEIDQERDVISDQGSQIVRYLRGRGIDRVLFAGVHTNMCVLKSRSFSLKALAEMGVGVYLVRDLTDSMYNPARAPYVDHDEGTRLVIEYIEKFLCPTVSSREIS